MNIKQIMLFTMVLLVGLTVVSAADIIDADATDVALETPQVEQANDIQEIAQETVQETDNGENNNTIENSVDNQKINVEKDTQIISNSKEIKNSPKTIILNNTNFNNYVEDSKFNENVTDGDTIDIDGKLDSPKFNLTINKAVNLISSKNNSYISLNSSSNPTENNGALKIIKEGSGTNITGLYFHNTHIRLENTTNVHIDNITFINENASIGFGIGAISVRD